ncbi:IMP 5'-nucleotidase [Blastocladiella emersonii ATCC 22665]|nr:IMP 5'-nucleotidase [Blastocladiella emersonii ATCC 22665]
MSDHFSKYRINYALRSHKRDAMIECIKNQLLSPFALHARPLTLAEVGANSADAAANGVQMTSAMQQHYLDIFGSIEKLIREHMLEQDKRRPESRLQMLVPTLGKFFTPLPLRDAFAAHDERLALSARRHVPPSFNEIRGILNTAQIMALAPDLKLITFDGDMTLYDDGANFEEDSRLVKLLVDLIQYSDLNVAIVTAAGYTEAERYEHRLSGLLKGFANHKLSAEAVTKFWVMGGECNYLFRCRADYHLERITLPFLPESYFHFTLTRQASEANLGNAVNLASTASAAPSALKELEPVYTQEAVTGLLDVAERILRTSQEQMRLAAKVIRKDRAVGIVAATAGQKLSREQLDECVLALQHGLSQYQRSHPRDTAPLPYCAFNGGNDVWVDIGNKLIGVRILNEYIGAKQAETLHVGDQFLSTGNDHAARRGCPTLWITSPAETADALVELLAEMKKAGRTLA